MRTSPNVIITGTPGVGKTVHCEQLAEETGLRHLSINHVAKERDCYETYDHELQTWVVDEDKVRSCNSYSSLVFSRLISWFQSCTPYVYLTYIYCSSWTLLRIRCFRVAI